MNERFLATLLTRRELLRRTAGLTLVTAGGGLLTHKETFNETLPTIRRFEKEMGDRPLSIEEAKSYMPLVADLFVKSVPTRLTVKEIEQSTIVVQNKFDMEEDQEGNHEVIFPTGEVLNSQTIKQLFIDYPKADISYNVAKSILDDAYGEGGEALGFVSRPLPQVYRECSYDCGGVEQIYPPRIFLFLNSINNAAAFQLPRYEEQTPVLQFSDLANQVNCRSQQPTVGLRTTLLHELVHFDTDATEKGIWFGGEGVFSFSVMSMFSPHANALEEFVADYFPARISALNDLPFRTGYSHEPHDFVNFENVLSQAGMSDNMLYRFHKSSGLAPFLGTIALSANHTSFENKKLFRFENDIFDMFTGKDTESFSPDWKRLKPYFPAVDTNEYQYVNSSDYELTYPQRAGCIRS